MVISATILVILPFISAILLSLAKNNTFRRAVTYVSSALIICDAIIFDVLFFANGSRAFSLSLGETAVNAIGDFIIIGDIVLTGLIIFLSFKYKQYFAAFLSLIQTALILWFEFSGNSVEGKTNIYIDRLSVVMITIIAVVGTLITVYACGYMKDYHNHHTEFKDRRRFFFAMLYIFLGAMFALVMSNNLIWMYFSWEITSVVSFLLIGYTKTKEAIKNCFRALWMNLLGGCGFAAAIVWAGIYLEVGELQQLIKINDGQITIIPVIFLSIAALTKSAQLPFSRWLLGAMVAPTPSSALLHSATMVKAGVYLLLRIAPLLSGTYAGTMVSLVGGFTFLIASMLAITVSDGKKVLAYSTISNLGLITACAGIGVEETVWAGIFLLIFHAVSKSLLFQTVGAIENTTGSRDIETMHGLVRRHPYLAWTLVIGIAGMFLAPFGMLLSKWAALKAFIDSGSVTLVLFLCFGSATTMFYWTKWIATVLASKTNDKKAKNTTTADQWFSILVHSALMILTCFAFPLISSTIVMPYIKDVYYDASQVISSDNMVIMMIMLVAIFFVPSASWFFVRRTHYKKAPRYINGVNAGDQMNYIDSMGEKKRFFLANWYLEDMFGEKKLWNLSVIAAVIAIIAFTVISIGGAL